MNKRTPRHLAPLRDKILYDAWKKYKNGELRNMGELSVIFKLDLSQTFSIIKNKENQK